MGNYAVIAEIGNGLVKLLREHLVPEVVPNGDAIGLCSPSDKGDMAVGIYLYDIKESGEARDNSMVAINARKQRYPSSWLELYYMITAYSNGDIKFRSGEEQKITGKVMEVLKDYPRLNQRNIHSSVSEEGEEAFIEFLYPDMEEKQRIWNAPNTPYKLSLFVRVAPAVLESGRTREVKRVVDMDFAINEWRNEE